jgi:hypothetical protein
VKCYDTELTIVSLFARRLEHRTNSTLPEGVLLSPMSPTYCFPEVIFPKISRESSRWARWRLPRRRLLWWHGIVIVAGVCHVPSLWNSISCNFVIKFLVFLFPSCVQCFIHQNPYNVRKGIHAGKLYFILHYYNYCYNLATLRLWNLCSLPIWIWS